MKVAALVVASLAAIASQQQGAQTTTPAPQARIYVPSADIVPPAVIKHVEPRYTSDALRAKIAGTVTVEAVVGVDGLVTDTRILQSLDRVFGLDDEAVAAAKQWVFTPGQLRATGQPVPVRVTLVLEFRIHGGPNDVEAEFRRGTVTDGTPGLVKAKVQFQTEPKYTSDAMRQKLQGTVVLDVVVGIDGAVTRARVATSLDKQFGLDDEAMKAITLWHFEPAMLNGAAVATVERVTMEFRLH